MSIVSLQNISIAFGGEKILDHLNLQIEKEQRVCLLGRNGVGKSTLMRILSGRLAPDEGQLQKDQAIKISYFAQEIPAQLKGTAYQIIAAGLGERGELLLEYHHTQSETNATHDQTDLHSRMEDLKVWHAAGEIENISSRVGLDLDKEYSTLSGGQKRRVLLARALVSEPDILLLDEPTNHLDIEAIAWLEEYLLRFRKTLLFVTHDRFLLRRLATRIIELDRGRLIDWSCDYETFLKRKQAVLETEEKEWLNFDKKLAEEEIWIQRGIRARRTRNEGRVRALLKMREERKNRRLREGTVSLQLADAQKSGKIVVETQSISFQYDQRPLIRDFSLIIARGDKMGIIGPNGCGKTTLVQLLLGKLKPTKGVIKAGHKLQVAYFDQMREHLDETKTVWENVLPNGNMVTLNGKSRHIVSYLQDFLFTPERSKIPVKNLSGGERNRLLLARLFINPANLLVFDEPTNDLDAETMELLEELLIDFKGTLLLISHDRAFLNNVVTSTLVFEGDAVVKEYIGGYDDWLLQKESQLADTKPVDKKAKKQIYKAEKKAKQKKKRTFKENQELKTLPTLIESLEEQIDTIHSKMADPQVYRYKDQVLKLKEELEKTEKDLSQTYSRWEYLEGIEE